MKRFIESSSNSPDPFLCFPTQCNPLQRGAAKCPPHISEMSRHKNNLLDESQRTIFGACFSQAPPLVGASLAEGEAVVYPLWQWRPDGEQACDDTYYCQARNIFGFTSPFCLMLRMKLVFQRFSWALFVERYRPLSSHKKLVIRRSFSTPY